MIKGRTLLELVRGGRLLLMAAAMWNARPFYRLSWLTSAARCGLLRRLRPGPLAFEELVASFATGPGGSDALRAWLQVGERLGEIQRRGESYRLRGFLARQLAKPEHDPVAAILEETATLHHALLLRTPELLASKKRWKLADQDGVVVARSSRSLEPVVREAINRVVDRSAEIRLLEVGAGSAVYIRHAAMRNPRLTAVGIEVQPEVAEHARANLRQWGLDQRATIETGDVRERRPDPTFDLATLHNNIYYFPVEDRVAVFEHLSRFLRPGGRLLLTTGCQGGSVLMEVLNLWGASTEGCGRLPDAAELEEQMRAAGFRAVHSRNLVPGESYRSFVATRGN